MEYTRSACYRIGLLMFDLTLWHLERWILHTNVYITNRKCRHTRKNFFSSSPDMRHNQNGTTGKPFFFISENAHACSELRTVIWIDIVPFLSQCSNTGWIEVCDRENFVWRSTFFMFCKRYYFEERNRKNWTPRVRKIWNEFIQVWKRVKNDRDTLMTKLILWMILIWTIVVVHMPLTMIFFDQVFQFVNIADVICSTHSFDSVLFSFFLLWLFSLSFASSRCHFYYSFPHLHTMGKKTTQTTKKLFFVPLLEKNTNILLHWHHRD